MGSGPVQNTFACHVGAVLEWENVLVLKFNSESVFYMYVRMVIDKYILFFTQMYTFFIQ